MIPNPPGAQNVLRLSSTFSRSGDRQQDQGCRFYLSVLWGGVPPVPHPRSYLIGKMKMRFWTPYERLKTSASSFMSNDDNWRIN